MPRKNAVFTLHEQATLTVRKLLFNSAKDIGKYTNLHEVDAELKRAKAISVGQQIKQYFDSIITPPFQTKILLFCLKTLDSVGESTHLTYSYGYLVKLLAITMLNVTDLSEITFSDFPLDVHETLFRHLPCTRKLQHLNIIGSYVEFPRFAELFSQGLLCMPNLLEFSWENCTDSIIERIALNCKRIRKIDVTLSAQVTNACIPALYLCEDLVDFQFSLTDISRSGYEKLLIHHPRLDTIDLIFLENFDIDSDTHYFESSIIYMEDKTLNMENLHELSIMHPHITCLRISLEIHNQLSILHWFHNVKCLHILCYHCQYHFDDLHDALKARGSGITELSFDAAIIDLYTLFIINQCCPDIIKLDFYETCIMDTARSKELRSESFKSLQSQLTINVRIEREDSDTDAIRQFMKCLLACCINIKSIVVIGFCFDDELLQEILVLNPMKQLEKLHLINTHLTMNSVDLLMEYCDNLCSLQKLNTWNIEYEEIRNFIFHLKRNNIELYT